MEITPTVLTIVIAVGIPAVLLLSYLMTIWTDEGSL